MPPVLIHNTIKKCVRRDILGHCLDYIDVKPTPRTIPRGVQPTPTPGPRPMPPPPTPPMPIPTPTPQEPEKPPSTRGPGTGPPTTVVDRVPTKPVIRNHIESEAKDTLTPEEIMESHITEAAYVNSREGIEKAQQYLDDNNVPYDIDPEASNDRSIGLKKNARAQDERGGMEEAPEHYVASRGLDIGNVENIKDIARMAKGDRGTKNYKKAKDAYNKMKEKYGIENPKDIKLTGHSEGGGHSHQLARETGSDATVFNAYITPDHSKDAIQNTASELLKKARTEVGRGLEPIRRAADTGVEMMDLGRELMDMGRGRATATSERPSAMIDRAMREAIPEIPRATPATSSKVKSIRTVNDVVSMPHAAFNPDGPEGVEIKTVPEIKSSINPRESHALRNFTNHGEASHTKSHVHEANTKLREAAGKAGEMVTIKSMRQAMRDGKTFTEHVSDVAPNSLTRPTIPREDMSGDTIEDLERQAGVSPGGPSVIRDDPTEEGIELQDLERQAREGVDEGVARPEDLGPGLRKHADLWKKAGGQLNEREEAQLAHDGPHAETYKRDAPSTVHEDGIRPVTHHMSDEEITRFSRQSPQRQERKINKQKNDVTKEGGLLDKAAQANAGMEPAREGMGKIIDHIDNNLSPAAKEALGAKSQAEGAAAAFLGSAVADAIDQGGDKTHATLHAGITGGATGVAQQMISDATAGGIKSALSSGAGGLAEAGVAGAAGMAAGTIVGGATERGVESVTGSRTAGELSGAITGGGSGMVATQLAGRGLHAAGQSARTLVGRATAPPEPTPAQAAATELEESQGIAEAGEAGAEAAELGEGAAAAAEIGGAAVEGTEIGAALAPETGGLSIAAGAAIGAGIGGAAYLGSKLDEATGGYVASGVGAAEKATAGAIRATGEGIAKGAAAVGHALNPLNWFS